MINEQNQRVLTTTLYMAVAFMATAGVYQLVKAYTTMNPVPTPLAQQTITVSATGKAVGVPDVAKISVGITEQGANVSDVTAIANDKMTAIINAVKAASIDTKDIRTTAYDISPRYDYKSGANKIAGYQITQSATITVRDLNKVADIIDQVTQAGANSVEGPTFEIDEPETVKTEARTEAFDKVKTKAEGLAKVAGVTLGDIVSFSENSNDNVHPSPVMYDSFAAKTADTSTPPSIEPGSQELNVTVSVTYRIK